MSSQSAQSASSRASRAWRGLAAATVATLAAASSHSLADGHAVTPQALALALAFATLVCVGLAGRRLSTWRLATSVALSQGAFHLVFVTLSPGTAVVTGGHHAEHFHVADAGAGVHEHTSAAMWVGHAIAALITIVLLQRGESAAHTIGHLLALVAAAIGHPIARAMAVLVDAIRPVRLARAIVDIPLLLPVAGTPAPRSLLFRGPPRYAL